MEIKTKTNKWELIKLKSLYTAKEITKGKKKKTTHRMGKKLMQFCTPKQTTQSENEPKT